MNTPDKPAIKLRHLSIRNYKGIDSLDIDFPEPRMDGDPDVIVLGSENGLGKTSVLECCALLLHAVSLGVGQIEVFDRHATVDIPTLLIRSGTESAEIEGLLDVSGGRRSRALLTIDRVGNAKIKSDPPIAPNRRISLEQRAAAEDIMKAILGISTEPALGNGFLMFHSFRKVREGHVDIGAIVSRTMPRGALSYLHPSEPATSHFKYLMLMAVLGEADILEMGEGVEVDSSHTHDKLNALLGEFAKGRLGKLRPRPGNTMEFLIEPGSEGEPFSYDGLSSGQKEIISTLALVWFHTRSRHTLVLIDEPELHLNAQWHRSFIRSLFSLAPDNQYILATHSEYIMDSVDEARRVFLSAVPETVG